MFVAYYLPINIHKQEKLAVPYMIIRIALTFRHWCFDYLKTKSAIVIKKKVSISVEISREKLPARLKLLIEANIRIMKVAGTVIVSRVSSNIRALRAISYVSKGHSLFE